MSDLLTDTAAVVLTLGTVLIFAVMLWAGSRVH
jgi:hypothetical protein